MSVAQALHVDKQETAAHAFDELAARYDDIWTHSVLGSLQREAVWREMDGLFQPDQRILDLGCGTGEDAIHLARAGVRVHATDASREMLRVATQRFESEKVTGRVTTEITAMEGLSHIRDRGPFDGAISNFGVLNCIQDLRTLASDMAALLRPSSRVLLCTMGRFCLWETLWYLVQAQQTKAFRRWSGRAAIEAVSKTGPSLRSLSVAARSLTGHRNSEPRARASGRLHSSFETGSTVGRDALSSSRPFHVYYPSVREITKAFNQNFRLVRWRSIGIFVPPSYIECLASRAPVVFRLLDNLDRLVGHWPLFGAIGDHRLLIFEFR